MTPTKQIVNAGGKKLGITAVIGKKYQQQSTIRRRNERSETALSKVVAELEKDRCDLLVLLAHATEEESIKLGENSRSSRSLLGGT